MAQSFRGLAALAQDLGLVCSIHNGGSQSSITSVPGDGACLLVSDGTRRTHSAHAYTQVKHFYNKNKYFFKK